ncbi:O-antigen biosynthesis glycosyltransferase WbnH [Chryseobacterium aquaeductus]|uniref:O-antigen biosynthesis glycosyltransferase WbnH n=1 Tax=Chryseobacterium aquaeductus TaxID=2675056 RepID=A0A9N8MPF1_9FLAO|nr:glycosyltransferase [Chryseobacterium aquaeductus]CAA7331627.1 O-antigen biosynthesis glycosyltransferase WbnH [Chryseobacterium potabilaquae]CAD7811339.1 O-antigen biosynthesis glycosyltransferase WbnH [Chryseobacterium aquaeductus]
MKILHVITRSDLGGAQSVVINLANTMCFDHDITVVAGENGPMWNALDDRITKIQIREIVREVSFFKDTTAFLKLKELYSSLNPDVVHLHSSKIGVLGRLAFPKSKIVYSIHGFDSIRIAHRKFLPLEKLLKNRCKAIVLASDYDKRNIIDEGIINNLHVVYNGVCRPQMETDLSIEKLELYDKVVMCIARISPQKRFDSFLEIARLLPKYAFVWIGADKKYTNLPSNVFCLESMPNAKRYIQLADIFVLPTNYEGVPIVIIDALSYGKPVVASEVGGISEIVRNGINGYVLENNSDSFAEKIKYILENKDVCKNFSDKSEQIYLGSLTIDEMVKQYYSIYKM